MSDHLINLQAAAGSRLLQTRLVSSMERIFPDRELTAQSWNQTECFIDEKINVQLAYRWQKAPAWGEIEIISQLSSVTVYTVELEPGEYVWPSNDQIPNSCRKTNIPETACSKYRTTPGLFPDILKPLKGKWKLVPCQWRALWISMKPEAEEPGEYPVTICVRVNGEAAAQETFLLRLLPLHLPKQKLIYTQWLHTDCIAHWYQTEVFSSRWWELTEAYLHFASAHGINMILTPLFTPPLDILPGGERLTVQLIDVTVTEKGYHFDFSLLEKWLTLCQQCGIQYFEGSHLFTQWGAGHAPKIEAWVNGRKKRIFGWETDAVQEEYTSFLSALLPKLTAFLKEKGYSGKFYFHISDEPSIADVEHYGQLSRLIHRLIGEFPVMDALSDYAFYEKGFVDLPICATEHIKPYLEHQTPHLWAYYCGCHVNGVSNRLLAMPGARNRCIGLQLYESGVEGFLHWGYNFWLTQYATEAINPYRVSDAGGSFLAGDSFSVYPGENGPIAAVSLELFSEALQDLRVLQLAEELTDRNTVREWYRTYPYRSFDCCPNLSEEVLAFRSRLNQWILSKIVLR